MVPERPEHVNPIVPIASIDDPRAIQLLATEHWSLLSARVLAYNEAFVRAGIFLTFLREQARIPVAFPTPAAQPMPEPES